MLKEEEKLMMMQGKGVPRVGESARSVGQWFDREPQSSVPVLCQLVGQSLVGGQHLQKLEKARMIAILTWMANIQPDSSSAVEIRKMMSGIMENARERFRQIGSRAPGIQASIDLSKESIASLRCERPRPARSPERSSPSLTRETWC